MRALEAKFRDLSQLPEAAAQRMIEKIHGLEQVEDRSELF